ncbi:MAG: Smr/MutS family endonuclease [Comamonadaceae bacterium]|nr:Smr/MutS family endonuclease [Comamonadaceae bacterium]
MWQHVWVKIQSLQDLKQVQKQIAAAQAQAAAEEAARLAALRKAEAEKNLFTRAIGKVAPLPAHNKAHLPHPPRQPVATQRQKDEAQVIQDSLSDEFDVSTLLDTDEALSFRRPSVGPEVTRKLRKGDWAIQREIDLHGLRSDEARLALTTFIRDAHKHGIRCVRVVHGKGLGSPGKTPVLKSKVHSWLVQKNQVMAFVQAKPAEGGAGALVVLLTPS